MQEQKYVITCVMVEVALRDFDLVCGCLICYDLAPAGAKRLDQDAPICSGYVLMEVETLGVARSLGWKVHMRCAHGYWEGTRSMRRCVYRRQLDLETLVATRGPNFPLSRLESRLMCPAC